MPLVLNADKSIRTRLDKFFNTQDSIDPKIEILPCILSDHA